MKQVCIPRATLGRLPVYTKYLKGLPLEENKNISATTIAKALNLGEVQVRKDLSAVSGAGKPKVGYDTVELIEKLEGALGHRRHNLAVIVGAGKLGKALLDYGGFSSYGLEIAAAFDLYPEKAGSSEAGKAIYSMEDFKEFCSKEGVKIGVITVPEKSAQKVCDLMIESGITAVWNFAPKQLSVPEGVLLQQENLALSLAHLNMQLNNMEK